MILAGKVVDITRAIRRRLENRGEKGRAYVCVYLPLCLCPCVKLCTCVPVVSNWDRHGAPAGNWAQASVTHLALETDVWL